MSDPRNSHRVVLTRPAFGEPRSGVARGLDGSHPLQLIQRCGASRKTALGQIVMLSIQGSRVIVRVFGDDLLHAHPTDAPHSREGRGVRSDRIGFG